VEISPDAPATAPDDLVESAEAYIPSDRRRALAAGADMPDRVRGAALFADISGFTPLTEALTKELGPQRAAEELTAQLNRVFHLLIAELERHGGDVIYFSGDAITCWLDGDDGARATACALAMQAAIDQAGVVVTPAGTRIRVAVKIAVTVGTARRFLVGAPDVQRIDVLAGRIIDELAAAEKLAEKGEVVLHRSALESLGERVELSELRVEEDDWREFGVAARLVAPVAPVAPDAPAPAAEREEPLPESVVREWLLPAVFERLRLGHGEFLAELRPAYPLFLRFGGIDYDYDDDAVAKLDGFVCRVQRILASYGGNLLNLTLGDKGAYLYAVFGAPRAHEDDAARAAAAALELSKLQAATAARDIQIGITYGRLRSGTYGHRRRRTFTCIGGAVNHAARLMAKCPPGRIYVSDDVRRAAGDAFAWTKLAALQLKGKAESFGVFALTGTRTRTARGHAGDGQPMVGREAEVAVLRAKLDEACARRGQVVGIRGDAGMGKSRLVAEVVAMAEQRGVTLALGACQAYGAHSSYFAWREVWSTLFGLDAGRSAAEQIRAVETALAAIDPSLVPRAPLLAPLLELPIPDNDLTAPFDAKLRKTSLEGLLVECLRARAAAAPLVLVLEDCHWLDPLSRDLVDVLGRALASLPVLLVLAYRPSGEANAESAVEKLPHFTGIALTELDAPQSAELIRAKLAPSLADGAEPPAALAALVTAKAQGNPFYIGELLAYIRDRGIDLRDEPALAALDLPESLHSLMLSRIDTLDELPRRTLKVASVVGRVFDPKMLPGMYADLGDPARVDEHLRALLAADLVDFDEGSEGAFRFKHVVTQEVAYESLPYALRATLHERCAGGIETAAPELIERDLDLLAHHYGRSENLPKKREYFARAGDAAQRSWANAAAISYFERLAPLVEDGERIGVLLKLGKVLEVTGGWRRAEEVESEALHLATARADGAACADSETALAEVARKQGRFDEALARLDRAAQGFRELHDDAGVGQVLHLVGTVAAQRGDYAKAVENYEASLAIRERTGDKAGMGALLSNLGVIAEYRGDYESSRQFHERALALRREIGDRLAIAKSANNLGMIATLEKRFDAARVLFLHTMQLSREVGDAWMVAVAHNNLGNANRGLGDHRAARAHYRDSLLAYRDYDDRWSLAFLLEDIGLLAASAADAPTALELIGAADTLRAAIGAPRAPSLAQEIERHIADAVAALPQPARETHLARGRALDAAAAVERALAYCVAESPGATALAKAQSAMQGPSAAAPCT
jgi:class 3 adenylate cyclase/tetratricopeptide (TPR) repeat protein